MPPQLYHSDRRHEPRLWVVARRWFDPTDLIASEEGTMAQVTVIVIMGFAMLLGLVGNLGRIVQQKVAAQNAADAVAYSTALWQARSMNAVTAINHLMGEVTSICVLHEAIGGPQLDEGRSLQSDEFRDLNNEIKKLSVKAVAIHFPVLQSIDEEIINLVRKAVTFEEGSNGTTSAGATLYDSRITLKQLVVFFQNVKVAANALMLAGKIPVVAFLIPIGMGLHAISTPILIKCGIEAGMLLVLEYGAKAFIIPKHVLEQELLPLLSSYSDDLVKSNLAVNPLASSIEQTVQELQARHAVKANVFPHPRQINLPLTVEADPKTASGQTIRTKSVSSGWPGNIDQLRGKLNDVTDIVDYFNNSLKWFPGADKITGWFKPNLPTDDNDVAPGNFSLESLDNLNCDWSHEERTQWVRASYPWVDALRAPVIKGMKQPLVLQLSKAGVWYGHWTNRFTLAKSFCYRAGKTMSQSGGQQPQVHMYVMQDMRQDRKGRESWTTDSPQAERLFTVLGFATHSVEAVFSPVLYGSAAHEQVTIAQAMYYNANDQRPGNSGDQQPNVGWDTLNWQSPVNVPEYGTVPTERGSLWPPWSLFQRKTQSNTPVIKLNWQAKLVPVTRRRLAQATAGGPYQGNIREALVKALAFTRQLDSH